MYFSSALRNRLWKIWAYYEMVHYIRLCTLRSFKAQFHLGDEKWLAASDTMYVLFVWYIITRRWFRSFSECDISFYHSIWINRNDSHYNSYSQLFSYCERPLNGSRLISLILRPLNSLFPFASFRICLNHEIMMIYNTQVHCYDNDNDNVEE